MTEGNPVTGHPYSGKEPPEGGGIPGEKPLPEDERTRKAPEPDPEGETSSRAAQEGEMSGKQGIAEPTPGVADPVGPPSPADATDADPPGGSAANQRGRVPDE